MNKFAFLILHYLSIDDTLKCVDSIKKINYDNYKIFIVDNGSSNNTGKDLLDKYKDEELVEVILSSDNLGFARGNNLGFKYIKDNYNPDFIVMINNDILINQNDFCNKIIDEFNNSNFSVLGPKIILPGNNICNFDEKMLSLKKYKKDLKSKKIQRFLNKCYLRYIYSIFNKIKNIFVKKVAFDKNSRKEDVLLHGCCLIFSKKYIDKFDGIDDRTFLYYEEQLLYIRLKKNNMLAVYNPEIEVFHNECSSTKKSAKDKRKRFDFVLNNEINSLNILIDEMEK